MGKKLSREQKKIYKDIGYIKNIPLYSKSEIQVIQNKLNQLINKLPKDVSIHKINNWHKCNKWFWELGNNKIMLNYVQQLIGQDFFQWSGQIFIKYPGDNTQIPWHQDAFYWPLKPNKTISIWLAVYDTNENNGALKVIPYSHKKGLLKHFNKKNTNLVLKKEAIMSTSEKDSFEYIDLKAGEVSIHDPYILHSSEKNNSETIRCGLVMRFSPTKVKCDLNIWPTFETYLRRGSDNYQLNPIGKIPRKNQFPIRKFQHSSEFN